MELKEYIEETLEGCRETLYRTLQGLSQEELVWRPNPETNSIAFIVWHMTRVEDVWVHRYARGVAEVWVRDGWCGKFGLGESDHGAGFSAERLANFPTIALSALKEYLDSVRQDTLNYLRGLDPEDFDSVPGRVIFPGAPAAAMERFKAFSVARMFRQLNGEEYQHVGHVGYLRGLQRGMNR